MPGTMLRMKEGKPKRVSASRGLIVQENNWHQHRYESHDEDPTKYGDNLGEDNIARETPERGEKKERKKKTVAI